MDAAPSVLKMLAGFFEINDRVRVLFQFELAYRRIRVEPGLPGFDNPTWKLINPNNPKFGTQVLTSQSLVSVSNVECVVFFFPPVGCTLAVCATALAVGSLQQ